MHVQRRSYLDVNPLHCLAFISHFSKSKTLLSYKKIIIALYHTAAEIEINSDPVWRNDKNARDCIVFDIIRNPIASLTKSTSLHSHVE